jgi:hypothetical protein
MVVVLGCWGGVQCAIKLSVRCQAAQGRILAAIDLAQHGTRDESVCRSDSAVEARCACLASAAVQEHSPDQLQLVGELGRFAAVQRAMGVKTMWCGVLRLASPHVKRH